MNKSSTFNLHRRSLVGRLQRVIWLLLAVLVWSPTQLGAAAAVPERVTRQELAGDRAFARRGGTEHVGESGAAVSLAVAAYSSALKDEPANLAVRVKLLHSLFFKAEYVDSPGPTRRATYDQGREVFERGFQLISEQVGRNLKSLDADVLPTLLKDIADAGPFYFWGAMHWGLWAESVGKTTAVRNGVLGKVRLLSEGAAALSPSYESYGPLRVLGRLHHLTPRIPLFTGWVDRHEAVRLLQRSSDLAPDEPLNKTFLAHVLWQVENRDDQALELLREVVRQGPRSDHRAEDLRAIEGARELIDRIQRRRRG